jgi:hypothetical protein
MATYDHILTNEGDLAVKNGDLLVDESTGQHQGILILAEKGTIRQFGDAGVGASSYLLGNDKNGLMREISRQCFIDGMKVNSVKSDIDGQLILDAAYEQ